jgi:hypothetical protein
MAEHAPAGPTELGAPMDYAEHERTFNRFVALTKVTVLGSIITMIALALYGFGRGGFWLGTLLIIMMMIAAAIDLGGGRGSVKALVGVAIVGLIFGALSLS